MFVASNLRIAELFLLAESLKHAMRKPKGSDVQALSLARPVTEAPRGGRTSRRLQKLSKSFCETTHVLG